MVATKPVKSFYDIPGWFRWLDMRLFGALLSAQRDQPPGDLVELGAYLGKSAVVIGRHLRPAERFVVVDLFEDGLSTDNESRRESTISYRSLTREAFEANYLSLHDQLPTIVQGLTSTVIEHVEPGSARFVHVDASHLYDNVAIDIANAESMLRPGGLVVLDDYRAEHTPGVAAAAWEAAAQGRLTPFLLTPHKFYAVLDDPQPYLDEVLKLFVDDPNCRYEQQSILGHSVIRARQVETKTPLPGPSVTQHDLAKLADDVVTRIEQSLAEHQVSQQAARPDRTRDSPARRLARDWLPPAVTRAISRRRHPHR